MKRSRRQFLYLAAGAAALPAFSRAAKAQTYPSRPVRLIVGFAAGGSADIVARLVGQRLTDELSQPFIVENRPGAGTNIGTEAAAKAMPDFGGSTQSAFKSPALARGPQKLHRFARRNRPPAIWDRVRFLGRNGGTASAMRH
jgi:tripartite-type tricarboxylate transporter receptor subunit TctC